MRPTIHLLWALNVHGNDQLVLRVQVDQERVGLLDPNVIVDALSYHLDHNVDLMRCAPDAHHVVVSAIDKAGDNANMMAHHGVLVVRRRADQLSTPLNV